MAKLERKSQKVLGGASGRNGQFGSAQSLTRILSNDPDVIQALPAWESGWNSAVMTGDRLPAIEEFQGVDYVTTYQLSYLLERGIPEYSSDTTYYINAIVMEQGTVNMYRSLINDNTGEPLSNPAAWGFLANLADVGKLNNYTATTNPTINDDETDGYSVGSIWYNTSSGDSFLCVDASAGAADWVNISLSVGALGTAAFKDYGSGIGDVLEVVNVGGNAGLPSIDGRNLTNIVADADDVTYSNLASGLSATNVQSAIDEVVNSLDFSALRITYDNSSSGLSATTVQGAIDEVSLTLLFSADRVVTDDSGWSVLSGTDNQTVLNNLDTHLQGIPKFNSSTVSPTNVNDGTEGYIIGSWWVNTATSIAYVCLDNSTGAAVWREYTNVLNNYSATVDPDSNNDQAQGYSAGSIWFNSTSGNSFLCTSAATGAAVWIPTSIDISDLGTAAFENYGTSVGDLVMFENDGSGGPALPASSAQNLTNINAESIGNGSVSNTEFQYLDGVSSGIQNQLNNKIDGPLTGDISTSGSAATINVKFATPVSLGSGTHTCSLSDGDWHRITTTDIYLTINADVPNGKSIVIEGFDFDTGDPNVSAFDWGAVGEPEWTDHDIFIVTRNNDGDYIAILVTQGLGA